MQNTTGFGLFSLLIQTLDGFVAKLYGQIMGSWPGLTITTLYVVIVGYMVIMGRAGEKWRSWASSAVLLSIIGGIAGNYGTYNDWIVGPIYDMAYKLCSLGAAGGSGLQSTFTGIEEAFGRIMFAIDELNVPGNFLTDFWLYFKVGIACLVLCLLAAAHYVTFLALLCIAMFSLFMVLAAGGPCLWFAAFSETRFITWAWFRALVNYSLWLFFLGAVSGVGAKFLNVAANDITRWDIAANGVFTKTLGGSMLLIALSLYMLLKAADWAAALSGGSSTNTGVVGAVGGMAGGALGGAMSAAGSVAGGLLKTGAGAAASRIGGGLLNAYSKFRGLNK